MCVCVCVFCFVLFCDADSICKEKKIVPRNSRDLHLNTQVQTLVYDT